MVISPHDHTDLTCTVYNAWTINTWLQLHNAREILLILLVINYNYSKYRYFSIADLILILLPDLSDQHYILPNYNFDCFLLSKCEK